MHTGNLFLEDGGKTFRRTLYFAAFYPARQLGVGMRATAIRLY